MLDDKKIQELKDAHGSELVSVDVDGTVLVFRKPTRTEFDRWIDKTRSDNANGSKHARELVKSCRVYPDEPSLDAALERRPAMLTSTLLDAVTEMAGLGGGSELVVKKL